STIFGVIPKPDAEFSPLAMTRSTRFCDTKSARRSRTISRPGDPTMSPMNSTRMKAVPSYKFQLKKKLPEPVARSPLKLGAQKSQPRKRSGLLGRGELGREPLN